MRTKYIFIVGGVMSGVGKGITVSAIARLLKDRGLVVAPVKIDPYINVDAGTMSPTEHGEIFVTNDGMECDQDIGNYERFLGEALSGEHSITTGQVYLSVIERERNLGYGGRCVEAVPDIPNEVLGRLAKIAQTRKADIVLVEIGGTVGEYQNLLYLEAARLLRQENPKHVAVALVSYLPVPISIGEMKTKPTQQAVRALQAAGLQPDFIIARAPTPIDEPRKRKLALFCNVPQEHIIGAPDTDEIYRVPKQFAQDRLGDKLLAAIGISGKRHVRPPGGLSLEWRKMLTSIDRAKKEISIGIVGKYFTTGGFVLKDVYHSVIEAVRHAAWKEGYVPKLTWIDAELLKGRREPKTLLKDFAGVIVPGGFGDRGIEGKIRAIRYVREAKIPYLGLCYGMQLAVVEYARNVLKLSGAHTTESKRNPAHPVIDILPDQTENLQKKRLGASMRLGAWTCAVRKGTVAARAYGLGSKGGQVSERHRHRYELNNDYRQRLEDAGLIISGVNPDRDLAEIVELKQEQHPFFVATQFHPEFQSAPTKPHPLFRAFIRAAGGDR